ncbi:hypothetical protein STENM223S_02261 [Streptomyces tendae]
MLAAAAVAFGLFSSAPAAGALTPAGTARSLGRHRSPALSTGTPVVFVHGYTGSAAN